MNIYVRQLDQTERGFLRRQIKELQREQESVQNKIDGLVDLLLDKVIDLTDFERKKLALRQRQREIDTQLANNREGDDNFKNALISFLYLMSDAYDLFMGSTTEQKRRLINFMFANLELKGTTLCYKMKKPFDLFLECTSEEEWCALEDSNLWPLVPETNALTPFIRANILLYTNKYLSQPTVSNAFNFHYIFSDKTTFIYL